MRKKIINFLIQPKVWVAFFLIIAILLGIYIRTLPMQDHTQGPVSFSGFLLNPGKAFGGTPGLWDMIYSVDHGCRFDVTLLNLRMPSIETKKAIESFGMKFIRGNALSLPFRDRSYDIVFSNAVVDHLSSFKNQKIFADEVRRVGKRYFIETGNADFFFEPHYLTPFVHYLPKEVQKKIVRNFTVRGLLNRHVPREKINKLVDEIILSTEREFRTLFPEAGIIKEKFLGFTKAFIAVKS